MERRTNNLTLMYNPSRLGDVLDALDDIHSAVSDGRMKQTTTVTAADLREWLGEIIYMASQTLEEMDVNREARPVTSDGDTNSIHLVRKLS